MPSAAGYWATIVKQSTHKKDNFKRKSRIFKAFLEELEITENQDQLLLEKNTIGFHKNWRGAAFSHLKNSKIDNFIDLKNYDNFLKYYKEGKGIILVGSHFGMAEISLSFFPLKGYDNFYTIVGDGGAETMKFQALNKSINSRQLIFSNESNTLMIKALFEARNILNEGGIIHVLGDGHQGNSNLTLPFLNKMRGYRASFAELGLSTTAHIIPILISMDMGGRFKIRFVEPLDKGDEGL